MRILTVILLLMLPGCSTIQEFFSPQTKIARLCTQVTERNAGVSCLKEAYSILGNVADTVNARYLEGRVTAETKAAYGRRLNDLYGKIETAEAVVLFGNPAEVQGQIDILIYLLEELERGVK